MQTISPLEKFHWKKVLKKITAKQINFPYFFFLFSQRFEAEKEISLIEDTYKTKLFKIHTTYRTTKKKNGQIIYWSLKTIVSYLYS